MCLRRAPEKYIAGAALDRAALDNRLTDGVRLSALRSGRALLRRNIIFLVQIFMLEAEYTTGPSAAASSR
jgi:hypothetical protein